MDLRQHWDNCWSAYVWVIACAVGMWWAVTHP